MFAARGEIIVQSNTYFSQVWSDCTANAAGSEHTSAAQVRFVASTLKKLRGIIEPMAVSVERGGRVKC